MNSNVIKSHKFHRVAANIKPDAKKRIVLSKSCMSEDVTYHVYCNEIGQILLDPQVSIPASEAWLYRDTEACDAVAAGLKEAAEGKVTRVNLDEL